MGARRLLCFVVATDPGVYPHTWWARAARPGAGSPPCFRPGTEPSNTALTPLLGPPAQSLTLFRTLISCRAAASCRFVSASCW